MVGAIPVARVAVLILDGVLVLLPQLQARHRHLEDVGFLYRAPVLRLPVQRIEAGVQHGPHGISRFHAVDDGRTKQVRRRRRLVQRIFATRPRIPESRHRIDAAQFGCRRDIAAQRPEQTRMYGIDIHEEPCEMQAHRAVHHRDEGAAVIVLPVRHRQDILNRSTQPPEHLAVELGKQFCQQVVCAIVGRQTGRTEMIPPVPDKPVNVIARMEDRPVDDLIDQLALTFAAQEAFDELGIRYGWLHVHAWEKYSGRAMSNKCRHLFSPRPFPGANRKRERFMSRGIGHHCAEVRRWRGVRSA